MKQQSRYITAGSYYRSSKYAAAAREYKAFVLEEPKSSRRFKALFRQGLCDLHTQPLDIARAEAFLRDLEELVHVRRKSKSAKTRAAFQLDIASDLNQFCSKKMEGLKKQAVADTGDVGMFRESYQALAVLLQYCTDILHDTIASWPFEEESARMCLNATKRLETVLQQIPQGKPVEYLAHLQHAHMLIGPSLMIATCQLRRCTKPLTQGARQASKAVPRRVVTVKGRDHPNPAKPQKEN